MPLKLAFIKSRSKPIPKPPSKGKAVAGQPLRSSGQTASKKPNTAQASRTASAKPTSSRSRRAAVPAPLPPLFNLSDERKLDVLGVALALGGVITILTLVSANRSELTGSALSMLSFFFGWSMYILPVALILFGGWLVLRKIERIPPVSVERATGLVLLFFFVQTLLQGIAGNPAPGPDGGGWLGNLIYSLFQNTLGEGALIVVMLAWLLIAL